MNKDKYNKTYHRWGGIFTKFPTKLIDFVGTPHASDAYSVNGFRHEIAIPADQFPEIWKDLIL